MFFESWSDFLNMGGYGFYVWLSYGISLISILIFAVQSYHGKAAVFREIKREELREQRLQATQSRGKL
ncbi:heme exporter protein CcmD [Pasteurella bettyae]|uniref:Heme exporter protein D n=1 Tax=Pasteurella bettyae CCUG 2042 TaxID=1095749 RepID=I3DH89_9PAST|nr:heme exporter protein CcmD [Pasteurella bettyae]EIJ71082.1 heme exporter protein CcmD [Pasteurella bettyae CCUG 2042]SUB22248.1 heme exporter protein D [Pasteurella bettyae]